MTAIDLNRDVNKDIDLLWLLLVLDENVLYQQLGFFVLIGLRKACLFLLQFIQICTNEIWLVT